MTVTRAGLVSYLAVMIKDLAEEAQIALTDTSAGIAYALDQAMADLGEDLDNTSAGYALAEYHALRRLRAAFAARLDFDATATAGRRSQLYNQTDSLIADAAQRAASAGHPVTSTASSAPATTILWSTDWQEPEIISA
jgi:hypothetical protein